MKNARRREPKDSERPVGEWLHQIGATSIEYVGDDAGGGPPDYTIEYGGKRIAVEVRLLDDGTGWPEERKRAFERELKEFINEVTGEKDAAKWHTWAEYDPEEPGPPRRGDKGWRKKVREALLGEWREKEIQLLPTEKTRGRGIILTLSPAHNEGGFGDLSEDEGLWLASTLTERVTACVKEKAEKVEKGSRAHQYDRWWLVLDDEVLITPKEVLNEEERARVEQSVRMCAGRSQWSKVVVVSRFQTTAPPEKQPKWFWPMWEDERHTPLPESPA